METHILQYVGAILALMVGLNGLIRPLNMGKIVGLAPENKVGIVEIRVLFGSFLVTLPIFAMLKSDVELFVFFGAAALAAAVIKSTFTIIDNCPIRDIWIGITVDVVLAALLLSSVYL